MHYDAYDRSSSFLWDSAELMRFDDPGFMSETLGERISGVGLSGEQLYAHAQSQAALLAA